MNASIHPLFPALAPSRQPRRGAFALVITLLILSLLVVVAVSYLSSMVGERQTADAYTSKTRAEDLAQAGVDSAMAILKQSFRDFPDSATVWDPAQSTNSDGSSNEGTSLYLRAVPDSSGYANSFPAGTAAAANAAGGNDPSNPACKNFVLPLVSGVPGGRAQLVSNKTKIFQSSFPKGMTLPTVTDPTTQNSTDLNVRRGSGDNQGVIGSPPGWNQPYPKPARAYWVPLKSKVKNAGGNTVDGPVTGRYAFWIEDESFRANSSYFGNTTTPDYPGRGVEPPDNTSQPTSGGKPRGLLPGDATLLGPLTLAGDSTASADAATIFNTRKLYPGQFFPDPLAFVHTASDGTSSFSTDQADRLRYLLTNQSGTLNLTRHGTQRLNLNGLIPQTAPGSGPVDNQALLKRVTQIVQTLKFHLPYLGERFYRTTTNFTPSILNNATQVPGSPKTDPAVIGSDNSEIYYWKVAANIEDYVDTDTQPTIIKAGGTEVYSLPTQVESINADQANQASEIWAQGKESAPYMQEAAVRWRPIIHNHAAGAAPPYAYDLYLDYYVEFWNMTDRDIYAGTQPDSTLPNLHGAKMHISNQQTWDTYPHHSVLVCNDSKNKYKLGTMGPDTDFDVDLTTGVYQLANGSLQPVPSGVVFKAGSCTVITTDPDFGLPTPYVFKGPPGAVSTSKTPLNTSVTFYCSNLGPNGNPRHYTGQVTPPLETGIYGRFRDNFSGSVYREDDEVHIALYNSYGYLDSSSCAISEHGSPQWINTDTQQYAGGYNDFSYTSCLFGNLADTQLYFPITPSQMGDPRTNNEQLKITQSYVTNGTADQSRFFYGSGPDTTLGNPNGQSQKPDATQNDSPKGYPWPDYYVLPAGASYPSPDATNAPMVVADSALTSVGQLGDVFDPARVPNPSLADGISYSRGGGRTFKVGQHDDLYSYDPTGSANSGNDKRNDVPASSGWASWRLADVFDAADRNNDPIELPARININGIRRDGGAALLSLLQGFKFQPTTTTDPVVHGDGHAILGSSSLATQPLDTTANGTSGFSQLITQMKARLDNTADSNSPTTAPSGPFFERGELGELGTPGGTVQPIFGQNPASAFALGNKKLVANVDMNKTFDHGREELVRRISQMICTRGDTFTIYAVGQSISQGTTTSPMRITGTQRIRATCRLVPKAKDPTTGGYIDFHPGTNVDPQTGAITPKTDASFTDTSSSGRFAKPDHYDVQILQTSVY